MKHLDGINKCQGVAYIRHINLAFSFSYFIAPIGSVPGKYKVLSYEFLSIFLNLQGTPLFY